MLDYIPGNTSQNTTYVCLSGNQIYHKIPHEYQSNYIFVWKCQSEVTEPIYKIFITAGIKYLPHENEFYRDMSGTAKGTEVVPTNAYMVMQSIEIEMYEPFQLQLGLQFH